MLLDGCFCLLYKHTSGVLSSILSRCHHRSDLINVLEVLKYMHIPSMFFFCHLNFIKGHCPKGQNPNKKYKPRIHNVKILSPQTSPREEPKTLIHALLKQPRYHRRKNRSQNRMPSHRTTPGTCIFNASHLITTASSYIKHQSSTVEISSG